jgi:REP element-mobilizing transposase RayT
MARAWRIEYAGGLYHVLSRGNDKCDIFFDDSGRRMFLNTLGELSARFDIDIFAYVLMDNHYHLLVRTQRANLSKSMQWFGATYTKRINLKHGRSGHLFQGRFKNMLIENDAYLLQLSCYIHRNPLRAGMVKRLVSYPWSSYRASAYGKGFEKWLNTEVILAQFGNVEDRHKAYREQAQQYSKEKRRIWEDLQHGIFLVREILQKKKVLFVSSKSVYEYDTHSPILL